MEFTYDARYKIQNSLSLLGLSKFINKTRLELDSLEADCELIDNTDGLIACKKVADLSVVSLKNKNGQISGVEQTKIKIKDGGIFDNADGRIGLVDGIVLDEKEVKEHKEYKEHKEKIEKTKTQDLLPQSCFNSKTVVYLGEGLESVCVGKIYGDTLIWTQEDANRYPLSGCMYSANTVSFCSPIVDLSDLQMFLPELHIVALRVFLPKESACKKNCLAVARVRY